MRFLPLIPAYAGIIAVTAIACTSNGDSGADEATPAPTAGPDTVRAVDSAAALDELPPNGAEQVFERHHSFQGKQQTASSLGMELYLPRYIPSGFHVIAHQINAYKFDLGTSFAAVPGSGSEIAVLQSAEERDLPSYGRSVDINGVQGVLLGGDEADYADVYFNRDGNHFIIASYKSIQCEEPCGDFSEAITLAVARSLRPVPLDPAAELPPGVEPLLPANGIGEAFPETHDSFLQRLEMLTRGQGFQLYLPAYIPKDFKLSPQFSADGPDEPDMAIAFFDGQTNNTVRIVQTPWLNPGPLPGPQITIGDTTGAIVGSGKSGSVEIRFVRDGVRFEILGLRNSRCQGRCRLEFNNDVFVRIADSLHPAVLDDQGIPRPAVLEEPAP